MVAERWPGLVVDHRHHAGSSSGVVDGAGALVMASPEYAQKNDTQTSRPHHRYGEYGALAGIHFERSC